VDVIAKYYKDNSIDKDYIKQRLPDRFGNYINYYEAPEKPYLNHIKGGGLFYSIEWGCLIIDEAQAYTNIETLRCQCLGSLYAKYRWLLSGTLFDEPKTQRILGYHVLLNVPDVPRNMPDTNKLLTAKDSKFKGLNEHLIYRKSNVAFIPPKIIDEIITHVLLPEEVKIYTMMKQILIHVKKKADKAKLLNNSKDVKKFSSYKLVMIMYLRQALLCPLLPITSISIDAADTENRSELSSIIMSEIKRLSLDNYLNDVNSIQSSRVKVMIDCLEKHNKERVIVFSCFKSYLDILVYFLENKNVFYMQSKMSMAARGELINNYRKSANGILLMTYDLGAAGLNLQCASTVLFADQFWNYTKSNQGIGRIVRYGQLAESVNVYFFSANTGIEKIIFEKQKFKIQVLEELRTGTMKSVIPKINVDEVIKIIELEDNVKSMKEVKYY
jgi:SNF2 family DNA or RNA helicase